MASQHIALSRAQLRGQFVTFHLPQVLPNVGCDVWPTRIPTADSTKPRSIVAFFGGVLVPALQV